MPRQMPLTSLMLNHPVMKNVSKCLSSPPQLRTDEQQESGSTLAETIPRKVLCFRPCRAKPSFFKCCFHRVARLAIISESNGCSRRACHRLKRGVWHCNSTRRKPAFLIEYGQDTWAYDKPEDLDETAGGSPRKHPRGLTYFTDSQQEAEFSSGELSRQPSAELCLSVR